MPSDAFKALVEQLFASPLPDDFPAMREAYLGMGDAFPLPGDIVVEQATIGGCPCEWVTAPGTLFIVASCNQDFNIPLSVVRTFGTTRGVD